MGSAEMENVLVTGACGQIGRAVSSLLRDAGRRALLVDVDPATVPGAVGCDLRAEGELSQLFRTHSIRAVIHLAGILPSAFQCDPLGGADVNLNGSLALMRQAAEACVKRFVFASSMSVYGTACTQRALSEDDPAAPDEPYGASKLAIELIGDTLSKRTSVQFLSLRIARVVGPGARKTSSPWRSQIFERPQPLNSIHIPFRPEATLCLVHVEDVARMLTTLVDAPAVSSSVYNTPVEMWTAQELKEAIAELRNIPVELDAGGRRGGPMCEGSRFALEFGFRLRGVRDRLSKIEHASEIT
jgi:nucleoside-diphosphate-sugar epimerase